MTEIIICTSEENLIYEITAQADRFTHLSKLDKRLFKKLFWHFLNKQEIFYLSIPLRKELSSSLGISTDTFKNTLCHLTKKKLLEMYYQKHYRLNSRIFNLNEMKMKFPNYQITFQCTTTN
jgi:hypothetical protein